MSRQANQKFAIIFKKERTGKILYKRAIKWKIADGLKVYKHSSELLLKKQESKPI
jgi:hypothetical protein